MSVPTTKSYTVNCEDCGERNQPATRRSIKELTCTECFNAQTIDCTECQGVFTRLQVTSRRNFRDEMCDDCAASVDAAHDAPPDRLYVSVCLDTLIHHGGDRNRALHSLIYTNLVTGIGTVDTIRAEKALDEAVKRYTAEFDV
jgi:hypothetical protein